MCRDGSSLRVKQFRTSQFLIGSGWWNFLIKSKANWTNQNRVGSVQVFGCPISKTGPNTPSIKTRIYAAKSKEKPLKSYEYYHALKTIKINRNRANIKMPSLKKLIKLNNNIIMYIKKKNQNLYDKRRDLWLGYYIVEEQGTRMCADEQEEVRQPTVEKQLKSGWLVSVDERWCVVMVENKGEDCAIEELVQAKILRWWSAKIDAISEGEKWWWSMKIMMDVEWDRVVEIAQLKPEVAVEMVEVNATNEGRRQWWSMTQWWWVMAFGLVAWETKWGLRGAWMLKAMAASCCFFFFLKKKY